MKGKVTLKNGRRRMIIFDDYDKDNPLSPLWMKVAEAMQLGWTVKQFEPK